jgi:hypothetical protein
MSAIGRLVIRIEDDSPCPLVGEVIGQQDEDLLIVAWGDERFNPDGSATGTVEYLDELTPWRAAADAAAEIITGRAGHDGTEPYCRTCGEWAGLFRGLEGWHHYRGDPGPGGVRARYAADHAAVIGWVVPPGRGLSPAGLGVLAQALADAVSHRDPSGFCADCERHPAGLCYDHAADLDTADAYLALARGLGIEADR